MENISRRKYGKYCTLTFVSFYDTVKAIWDMYSYVYAWFAWFLDSHGSCQNRSHQHNGAILLCLWIGSFLEVVTWVLWVPPASFTVNIGTIRHTSGHNNQSLNDIFLFFLYGTVMGTFNHHTCVLVIHRAIVAKCSSWSQNHMSMM